MDRRSFLSLLVATPAIPMLAKLHTLAPASPAPALAELEPLIATPTARLVTPGFFRVAKMALPFAPDEGFDWLIAPGRIARFVATPQRIFRPERLLLSAAEAGGLSVGAPSLEGFELLGVSAAGEPQLEESIPADFFDPLAFGGRLEWRATEPGFRYVMAVRNGSSTARHFHAAMIGISPDDSPPPELTPERLAELEQEERELDAAYEAGETVCLCGHEEREHADTVEHPSASNHCQHDGCTCLEFEPD